MTITLKSCCHNLLEELRRRNIFQRNCGIFWKNSCIQVKFLSHKNHLTSMPYTIFLGLILTSALFDKKCPYSLSKPQKKNALDLEKLREKIYNYPLLLAFYALFWLYQYNRQIPFFFQFLMIVFSHNNQQLVTVTVIVVTCFSHW